MKFCDERIQKHLLNDGKIKRVLWDFCLFFDGKDLFIKKGEKTAIFARGFIKEELQANDWEIVEPEYDWEKIIEDKVLCVFSDDEDRGTYVISPLIKVEGKSFSFMTIEELSYSHCKPFNPADYNIAKDLKEYEK